MPHNGNSIYQADEQARAAYADDLLSVTATLNQNPAPVHPLIARGTDLHTTLSETQIKNFLTHAINSKSAMPRPIPRKTHRVWLTDRSHPQYPSDYFLLKSAESFECTPDDWEHTFWVRHSEHGDVFTKYFHDQGFHRVRVRTVESLPSWGLIGQRIDDLIDRKLFVAASDVARLAVLSDNGGLYCDLGIRLNYDISTLLVNCHYAFQWGTALFLQNSMMATVPGDPLFRAMTLLAAQPHRLNRHLVEPLTAESEMWIAGGPGISLLLYLMAHREINLTIFTSNGALINHEAQQSWYRPVGESAHGNHGNALVTGLAPITSPQLFQDGPLLADLAP